MKKHFFIIIFLILFQATSPLTASPVNDLLNNPAQSLKSAQEIAQALAKEGSALILPTTGYEEQKTIFEQLVKKYEASCPFFMLGECITCALTRSYYPQYRAAYEDAAVSLLSKKVTTSTLPVHYVSFGSGHMFQDFVIITKLLAQHPQANIALHAIDLQYSPYVKIRDILNNSREITTSYHLNFNTVTTQVTDYARLKWGGANLSNEEIIDSLNIACMQIERRMQQMLRYLKITFPQARVSLILHKSSKNYLSYIEKNNLPYPDIVLAADIEDEISLCKNSIKDYAQLCISALQKNNNSSNLWLGTNTLTTINLNSDSHATPEYFITSKDEKLPIYLDKQNILSDN